MDCDLPSPECAAFLICREILDDKKFGDVVLVGQPRSYQAQFFPAAVPAGFFIRLTEARGEYIIDVQLRDEEGEIVWRDRKATPHNLPDPLQLYDLKFHLCPVFPKPGPYEFVVTVNGKDVARQRFEVLGASQKAKA
jgi:hypothetical protein